MESSFPLHDHIQQQRRALSEETVSYAIYFPKATIESAGSEAEPDTKTQTDQEQTNAAAHYLLDSIHIAKTFIYSIVTDLTKDYIWHKDAFSLHVETKKDTLYPILPYLKGESRVCDSLDDEWLIVSLLREITRRIPGTIARIQDNDGEFLLIEAAEHIPSWLDPENSDNRVFIHNGDLHIIPIAVTADEKKIYPPTLGTKSESPKLQDALEIIWTSSSSLAGKDWNSSKSRAPTVVIPTLASPAIQRAAFGPLSSPLSSSSLNLSADKDFVARKIQEQKHYARCQIPLDVARVLKIRPELVTRACEAFYTRDALGMAACSRMAKFLPRKSSKTASSDKDDLGSELGHGVVKLGKNSTLFVTTSVCFTKTCYAQLMGQQFHPPKIWDGIVPPISVEDANDPQKLKEAELGMKLTCGFEILCSPDYPGDFGFKSGDEIQLEDFPFATDSGWIVFKNNLAARQYFGDERPGSQKYQQLEETAKRQFLENKSAKLRDEHQDTSYYGHGYHPVQEIERILNNHITNGSIVNDLVDDRPDDDDSWMNVDLQMLEDMMRARGFGNDGRVAESGSKSSADIERPFDGDFDMQQMLNRFGEFVQKGQGGVEGAEFLDEQTDSEDDEDSEDDYVADNRDGDEAENQESVVQDILDSSDDEDIFASDYEERQARKRTAQRQRAFMFGSEMMNFDIGDTGEGKGTKEKVDTETHAENLQPIGLDREKFREALERRFGQNYKQLARGKVSQRDDDEEKDIDMDDQGLQEYMDALDIELSATKVGESFEKMSVGVSAASKTQPKTDKGKGVSRISATTITPQSEKNLEELVKEYAERSRRGFGRHGGPYGYDPAAMAFADDDEEEEPSAARVSTDDEVGDEIISDVEKEEERVVVDEDLNLAKNLLESFRSQGGLPGPAGNILSRLGIMLPRDEADDEDDEDDEDD